jgi:glycosyltransferase involved in cell wall biosynthesis
MRPLSILALAPLPPWPVNSGSKVRMFHLTRALSARHRVTLFSLRTSKAAAEDVRRQLPAVELLGVDGPPNRRGLRSIFRSMRRGEPIHVAEAWSPRAADELARLQSYDVLHVFHLTMVQYLPLVRGRVTVYDPMGDESVYMERLSRTAPAIWRPFVRWNLRRVRVYETRAAGAFDAVLSVSAIETPRFERKARAGATVATVPIAPDTGELLKMVPTAGTAGTVLFGGTLDWFPNIDAVRFLAEAVWPMVRERIPSARLIIAGKDPVDEIRRLESMPHVKVVANPPSMFPLLRDAAVVAVPVRTGSGIKIKTVEAMAAGKAIVATNLGCEGWDVVDGVHLRRADDAGAFAEAVVELLSEESTRLRLGASAQELVRERYTIDRMVDQIEAIYRSGLTAAGVA